MKLLQGQIHFAPKFTYVDTLECNTREYGHLPVPRAFTNIDRVFHGVVLFRGYLGLWLNTGCTLLRGVNSY